MADNSGLGACYRLYKDARRDIHKVTLNPDEETWLSDNGVERDLPDWRRWIRTNTLESLRSEVKHLKELTTKERRSELRLLHGGRMRRIQDQADAGKIGAVIRSIMAKSKSFSLDVLYSDDGNTTDADEISRIVTEFFKEWFSTSPDDSWRDEGAADLSGAGDTEGWKALANRLNVKWELASEILDGMKDKPISAEGVSASKALNDYCPSLEEFNGYIETMNPRSEGGPSGLTYLMVQQ